ncbi:MAG: hypothetical protein RMJ48_12555 [Roseiflexaceae bacterium]|nr:hypothetical protein [Roseiflexaceae bacterium]
MIGVIPWLIVEMKPYFTIVAIDAVAGTKYYSVSAMALPWWF